MKGNRKTSHIGYFAPVLLLLTLWCSCKPSEPKSLEVGEWLGLMQLTSSEQLPFNFELKKDGAGQYEMIIRNADEEVIVDEFTFSKDSVHIQMPVFEGYISAVFTNTTLEGAFIKESLNRTVPFEATFGESTRFGERSAAKVDVSGIWKVDFDYDSDSAYPAKGIFYQEGNKLTGTFRTTTGDYRFLEGVVDGNTLKLSTFDGAHVFLFTAVVEGETMEGVFYSGNHAQEKFKAIRDETFELPDASTLTYLKEGYDRFDFSFPNGAGEMISLGDGMFKDKVVLVQIMGTWCPNCLDETKFYVNYLKEHPNTELQIVGLAFEYAKTKEKAFRGIQRLKDRIDVDYPILLAQVGTSNKTKANEKLPMLNHVLSYPTTIYLDKMGKVRKIHTGFNGPATGEKYLDFQKEFDATITELLAEKVK